MSPAAAVRGVGGRGFTEQTILICAMIGAAQMTWGVVVPILPLFVEQFGVAATALGPVIAAFAIGRIIANVPAGVALRWWRPRPYLFAVMVGLAAITAATGLAQDLTAVFILRVIAGVLGGAAVTIGFAVLVAGAPAERRGSAMATATVVQMSAGAVGSVLGGAVITVASGAAVFVVAVVPLVAVLVWDIVRPARLYWEAWARAGTESSVDTDSFADTPPRPAWRELLGDGRAVLLVGLLVVSFATFMARFAGEQGMVPVLAYDSGGLTPLTLGVAMACGTVASLAFLPLVGRWADRGARLRILVPSGVAAAAGIAVFPLAGGPWQFGAAVVLYSVATSVANVVPGVVTGERFPARLTGTVIGLTRTAGDLGAVVGPLLVFAVAAAWGPVQAMLLIAAVLLVSVILFVMAYRRRTRPATSDS